MCSGVRLIYYSPLPEEVGGGVTRPQSSVWLVVARDRGSGSGDCE